MANRIELLDVSEHVTNKFFQALGRTYDSVFQEIRGYLIQGKAKQEEARSIGLKDQFSYEFVSTQQEFTKSMKVSASGKASFGAARVKAKGSISNFFSCNSYSCYIIGFFRIVHPSYVYDVRETELVPEMYDFIKKNLRQIDQIEKSVGDEIITTVTVASEITVKMEIQTNSEDEKQEIKTSLSASYGSASGKVNFSSIAQKVKRSKQIKISVYGDIPNQFIAEISPEEVDKLIIEFPSRAKDKYSIVEYSTDPISEIPDMKEFGEIVNLRELSERRKFIVDLDVIYQDILDWENDILYVISESNSKEFSEEVKGKATADWEICKSYKRKLEDILEDSYINWKTTGRNENKFSKSLLNNFPKNFPLYNRKLANTKPETVQQPQPVSRPARQEHHGGRHDHGGPPK